MLRKKRHNGPQGNGKLPIEHTGFYAYLVRYLEVCKLRGDKAYTSSRKESSLRLFIQWCDERSLTDPREITRPILIRYQQHLFYYRKPDGSALSFNTQRKRMTVVATWFKWLTRENYLPGNPASELELIKPPKKLPKRVLSQAEVQQILLSVDTTTPQGLRDRAILEVLYSTGIRRQECASLTLSDIDMARQSLFVREGKGSKDRYIPIGQRAVEWVQRYCEQVRPHLLLDVTEQHLFLTGYGEPFTQHRLGDHVRRLLDKAGYEGPGSCHLFRHAMATHMLENGAELRHLQIILGHENINTTTIYTHLAIDRLKLVHQQTHPAENSSP